MSDDLLKPEVKWITNMWLIFYLVTTVAISLPGVTQEVLSKNYFTINLSHLSSLTNGCGHHGGNLPEKTFIQGKQWCSLWGVMQMPHSVFHNPSSECLLWWGKKQSAARDCASMLPWMQFPFDWHDQIEIHWNSVFTSLFFFIHELLKNPGMQECHWTYVVYHVLGNISSCRRYIEDTAEGIQWRL